MISREGSSHRTDGVTVGAVGKGLAVRMVCRITLGVALVGAGITHLTVKRQEFQAQVPSWLPIDDDFVVISSGVVEIGLGLALAFAPRVARPLVGVVVAAFFLAIFPGNIAQYMEKTDAFGLNSDRARFIRLFFQPVLVAWALWSTGAWSWWRNRNQESSREFRQDPEAASK